MSRPAASMGNGRWSSRTVAWSARVAWVLNGTKREYPMRRWNSGHLKREGDHPSVVTRSHRGAQTGSTIRSHRSGQITISRGDPDDTAPENTSVHGTLTRSMETFRPSDTAPRLNSSGDTRMPRVHGDSPPNTAASGGTGSRLGGAFGMVGMEACGRDCLPDGEHSDEPGR